ncbi:MAG: TonB-dependent receptor [Novosphingobium sp.]
MRAPTPGDLHTPGAQTFINALADPCAVQNINANPNRARNCAAAGVPAMQVFDAGGIASSEPFTNRPGGATAALNAGNPDLREERGGSWTMGLDITPAALPGLRLSIDYHAIDIRDVIQTLPGQIVLDQCYDSPNGIDNPFCALVNRLPNGTFAGQGSVIHAGTVVSLANPGFAVTSQPFNYARLRTRGIDADLGWSHGLAPGMTLHLRALASWLIHRAQQIDIAHPDVRDRIKSELGDPAWRARLATTLEAGRFSLSHTARYTGRQILSGFQYETFFAYDGRPALNPDAAPRAWYPAHWHHDVRANLTVSERFSLYLGCDNLFDSRPPLDLLGIEGGAQYDGIGRFLYAGFRARL